MTNCIFYTVIFTLFITVTFGSLRYSQINRTFMSTYRGMFEASVVSVDPSGEPVKPYYDKNKLKKYMNEYMKPDIERFTKNYTLNLTYPIGHDVDQNFPRSAILSLEANINYFFKYSKKQVFTIKSQVDL